MLDISAEVEALEKGSSPKASENGSNPSKLAESIVVFDKFLAAFLDLATNVDESCKVRPAEALRPVNVLEELLRTFMSDRDDIV